MRVDFTNLDEARSKDHYPILDLNSIVNTTTRQALLSFMEVFSGYNQILMHEAN